MRAHVNFTTRQGRTSIPSKSVEGKDLQEIAVKAQKIGETDNDTYTYSVVLDGKVYHFGQDYGNLHEVRDERTNRLLAYDETTDDE